MKRKCITVIVFCSFIMSLCVFPGVAYIYTREETGTEIFAVGLYEYELRNTYRVLGNEEELRLGEEGLAKDWSSEESLRLYLDGLVRHHWRPTLSYDSTEEEETERLWAKLARGASYLFYGQYQLSFPDNKFIAGNKSLFGPELHLETRKNLFTGSFTEVKGLFARDEIAADGGSTYFVKLAPMVVGSEIIWIEARDPISEAIVSKTYMKRDIDYTIDYDTGEITFTEPIASVTPEGNINYIVVDYQYLPEAPGYKRYLTGLRNTYQITDRLSLGAGYLTQYDDRGSSTPELAGRNPQQNLVWGVDAQYKLGEKLVLSSEYGKSQQDEDVLTGGNEEERSAYKSELKGKLTDRSEVLLGYERTEPEFFSFNPEIEDDLEKYELSLTHQLTDRLKLMGGYEYSHDNILKEEEPTTTEKISDFGLAYEFGRYKYLGRVEFEGLYRFKDQKNDWYPQEGSQSKISSLKLGMEPSEVFSSFVKYEHEDIYAKPELEITSKKDTSTLGLEYSPTEKRSLTTQVQFIDERDLLTGESPYTKKLLFQTKRDLTRSLDLSFNYEHLDTEEGKRFTKESDITSAKLKYSPSERLIFSLGKETSRTVNRSADQVSIEEKKKDTADIEYALTGYFLVDAEYEREEEKTLNPQHSKLSERVVVRLPYEPSFRFSLTPGYEYEETRETLAPESLERKTIPSLKMDWFLTEKWELFTNVELKTVKSILPPPKVKAVTVTGLGRITYQISDRWDLMGEYEETRQVEPQKSNKDTITFELGCKITRNIRIGLGHRNIDFTDEAIPENDYQADMVYLRLTGKI